MAPSVLALVPVALVEERVIPDDKGRSHLRFRRSLHIGVGAHIDEEPARQSGGFLNRNGVDASVGRSRGVLVGPASSIGRLGQRVGRKALTKESSAVVAETKPEAVVEWIHCAGGLHARANANQVRFGPGTELDVAITRTTVAPERLWGFLSLYGCCGKAPCE